MKNIYVSLEKKLFVTDHCYFLPTLAPISLISINTAIFFETSLDRFTGSMIKEIYK